MVDTHHRVLLLVSILVVTFFAKDAVGQEDFVEQHDFGSNAGDLKIRKRDLAKVQATTAPTPPPTPVLQFPTSVVNQPGDLNIRYSRINFVNASLKAVYLPLRKNSYPIQGNIANVLKTLTTAASPILLNDPQLRGFDIQSYYNSIGSYPTYPTKNAKGAFWDEFRTVVEYQIARRNNAPTSKFFTLPNVYNNFSLPQLAQAVNNDLPGVQSDLLLKSFVIPQTAQLDYTIIPFRSLSDPIAAQHRSVAILGWVIDTIIPVTYAIKWSLGRPRPEEIAFLIAKVNLTEADGVPADLIPIIKSWNLTVSNNFTAYTQGSPFHPAWPGGHASVAQNAFWLSIIFNLTSTQYCEALRFDYAYGFARVLAGLHYPTDNYAAQILGQEVLARTLPSHLANLYGADPKVVAAKIAKWRFDLKKFVPANCTFLP